MLCRISCPALHRRWKQTTLCPPKRLSWVRRLWCWLLRQQRRNVGGMMPRNSHHRLAKAHDDQRPKMSRKNLFWIRCPGKLHFCSKFMRRWWQNQFQSTCWQSLQMPQAQYMQRLRTPPRPCMRTKVACQRRLTFRRLR